MTNPLIGMALLGLVFVGVVLMMHGATERDIDPVGGRPLASLLGGARHNRAEEDRFHPPARHPRLLLVIGISLIVVGFALGWAWTVVAF